MKLFFDTETTGKSDFRASHEAPHQPRVIQLGALLTEDDGTERGVLDIMILPDGFTIPEQASAIHGISTEQATRCGIPVIVALAAFNHLLKLVDEVIAHNDDFDHLVMRSEYFRAKRETVLPTVKRFCTMKAATNICKLPGNYGKFKWPSLAEAHKIIVGTEIQDAHDAMSDVRSCKNIYFALKAKGASDV